MDVFSLKREGRKQKAFWRSSSFAGRSLPRRSARFKTWQHDYRYVGINGHLWEHENICVYVYIYVHVSVYIYIGKCGVFRSLTLGVTIRLAESPCENEVETGRIAEFTVMTMLATAARKQFSLHSATFW